MLYGCDSGSNSFPCGANFYIGRLGYGTTSDLTYFNTGAATRVGSGNTFGYWFLYGPSGYATTPAGASSWGQQQANAAYNAWYNNGQTGRFVLFGDVEGVGSNGWGSDQALNQKVWEGFSSQLASHGLVPGLYSTNYQWSNIMGSGYNLNGNTPLWSADSQNIVGCGSCPTSLPALPKIGNETPTIWQYNGTPGCSNDLDAAASLP